MTLPAVPLPTDKVDVAGEQVEVRGLSRLEVARLGTGVYAGKNDDAEVFVLSRGANISEDEARAWLGAVHADVAGPVLDRICELSGLGEGAQKSS